MQELRVGRITVKDTIKTPDIEGMTLCIADQCSHQGKLAIVTLADSRVERGLASPIAVTLCEKIWRCWQANDCPSPIDWATVLRERPFQLRFRYPFFSRVLVLHEARNVYPNRAAFVLRSISQAAVNRLSDRLDRKAALVQGQAGFEWFVSPLVVTTGAPFEKNLFTLCK